MQLFKLMFKVIDPGVQCIVELAHICKDSGGLVYGCSSTVRIELECSEDNPGEADDTKRDG